MLPTLSRRAFVTAAAASGSVAVAPQVLTALLTGADAPARVLRILDTHLALSETVAGGRLKALIVAFTDSLRHSPASAVSAVSTVHGVHGRSGDDFVAAITSTRDEDGLALYLVQEFVVSTNYAEHLQDPKTALYLRGRNLA